KLAIWLTTMLAGMGGVQAVAQTTSAVRGNITEEDGKPVANATVTIVHEPTGQEVTLSTSATGGFFAPGLRVGGPYDVYIDAPGYADQSIDDLYLSAGQTESFTAALQPEATEVVITGAAKSKLGLNNGVGSKYTAQALQDQPSVNRDLTD